MGLCFDGEVTIEGLSELAIGSKQADAIEDASCATAVPLRIPAVPLPVSDKVGLAMLAFGSISDLRSCRRELQVIEDSKKK